MGQLELVCNLVCNHPFKRVERRRELEHRVGGLETELDAEKIRAGKVDADNVSLFEKVRYLQAYYAERAPKTPAPSLEIGTDVGMGSRSERWRRAARYGCGFDTAGGGFSSGTAPDALPGGDADGAIGRYDERHRATHDPYARFQEREAAMSEQRLRLHDRVALRGARAVMRSRVTRTFVVFYLGLMHLYLLYLVPLLAQPKCTAHGAAPGGTLGTLSTLGTRRHPAAPGGTVGHKV